MYKKAVSKWDELEKEFWLRALICIIPDFFFFFWISDTIWFITNVTILFSTQNKQKQIFKQTYFCLDVRWQLISRKQIWNVLLINSLRLNKKLWRCHSATTKTCMHAFCCWVLIIAINFFSVTKFVLIDCRCSLSRTSREATLWKFSIAVTSCRCSQ